MIRVSNDITTTVSQGRQLPVNKNLMICYNCCSEEYYDSPYNGKRHTRCVFAAARDQYDETKRETNCCRYFRRRQPNLRNQASKPSGGFTGD